MSDLSYCIAVISKERAIRSTHDTGNGRIKTDKTRLIFDMEKVAVFASYILFPIENTILVMHQFVVNTEHKTF